jgi:rod shape determining protein RodA
VEHRLDTWMVLAVTVVLGASLVTLHAVSEVVEERLFLRQLVWAVIGLALLWVLSQVHVTVYERLAPAAYAIALVSLVAVLLIGQERSGTRAWFALGPLSLQPSEFARLATAMLLATWFGRRSPRPVSLVEGLVVTVVVMAPVGLIMLEPDLGVAVTYLPLLGAALFLGGVPFRAWFAIAIVAALGAGLAWQVALKPYQKERILTVLDPERDPFGAGYQVRQSKIAVGSGRALGQGPGHGSQSQLRFLPAQHTDFAFAAWAEATGFVGTTALLLAYALLLGRIGMVAAATTSKHGLVLAVLVGAALSFQVLVNLGMVVGWLPTTGIPLPLFGYGGSSLLSTCAALGVVQSVWRHRLVNQ